jgi:hypothetical protein
MIALAHFIGAYIAAYCLYLPAVAFVDGYLDIDAGWERVMFAHVFAASVAVFFCTT